jgi:formamidopyrimidine-DNA glycosylase
MPELPDVEGFRRTVARFAAGCRVEGVHVPSPEVLRNATPQSFGRMLKGRRLGEPRRHGTWLVLPAEGRLVLLDFGATGGLAWRKHPERDHDGDRVIVELEVGELHYHAQPRRGGVWWLEGHDGIEPVTGPLGPDASDVTRRVFVARLVHHRSAVKSVLLDQSVVAGLGDELADEMLWRAGIAPRTRASAVPRLALARLHRAMGAVLSEAVRHGRVPRERHWLRSRRVGATPTCPSCGARLRREVIGGHPTVSCPRCQPDGGPRSGAGSRLALD